MAGNVDGPIWIVSQNDPLLADLERGIYIYNYYILQYITIIYIYINIYIHISSAEGNAFEVPCDALLLL